MVIKPWCFGDSGLREIVRLLIFNSSLNSSSREIVLERDGIAESIPFENLKGARQLNKKKLIESINVVVFLMNRAEKVAIRERAQKEEMPTDKNRVTTGEIKVDINDSKASEFVNNHPEFTLWEKSHESTPPKNVFEEFVNSHPDFILFLRGGGQTASA